MAKKKKGSKSDRPAHSAPILTQAQIDKFEKSVKLLARSVEKVGAVAGTGVVKATRAAAEPAKEYIGALKEDVNEKPSSAASVIASRMGGAWVGYLAGTAVETLGPYFKQALSNMKSKLGMEVSKLFHRHQAATSSAFGPETSLGGDEFKEAGFGGGGSGTAKEAN
ncbi:MAG: hypothetical protein GXO10_04885, partial [Crenarchaeota archaeon]|nr:hypothetical protein [Thermoproteota archaeon]